MNTITPIVMLLYVVGMDTKHVNRGHSTTPEPEASRELTDHSDTEYDTLITRRNIDQPVEMSTTEDEAYPKARKNKRSSHQSKKPTKKTRKYKSKKTRKSSKTHKDSEYSKETEYEKSPTRQEKSMEMAVERSKLRSSCVSETEKQIEKCLRACHRTHEDVCEKLKCSSRSKKALSKECVNNCKKIFDPKLCYRRYAEIE